MNECSGHLYPGSSSVSFCDSTEELEEVLDVPSSSEVLSVKAVDALLPVDKLVDALPVEPVDVSQPTMRAIPTQTNPI